MRFISLSLLVFGVFSFSVSAYHHTWHRPHYRASLQDKTTVPPADEDVDWKERIHELPPAEYVPSFEDVLEARHKANRPLLGDH